MAPQGGKEAGGLGGKRRVGVGRGGGNCTCIQPVLVRGDAVGVVESGKNHRNHLKAAS